MRKVQQALILALLISLSIPLANLKAKPGVHISVPHSPLAPNQPVYIEYYTDFGEDGTIQIDITKPPLLAIFWMSGSKPIQGGLLYDITAPGFSDPGTYVVSASVTLSGGGGTISGSTTFEVVQSLPPPATLFDFTIQLSPPLLEVEKGETAQYNIVLSYSDPSYAGTVVTYQVTGLGPGMNWIPSGGGVVPISTSSATPPGTYTITVIGSAQGVTHQTTATLIVREGPPGEQPPPEEPPPEQPPPEEEEQRLREEEEERRRQEEEQRLRGEEERLRREEEERRRLEEEQRLREEEEQRRLEEEQRRLEEEQERRFQTYLIIGILTVLAAVLIVALTRRRGKTPTVQQPQPSTRYCVKCGAPIQPGKAFCSSCGERVE